MTTDADEARRLRRTQADLDDEIDRTFADAPPLDAALVVKTISGGSYPTTAASVFKVDPVDVDSSRAEGSVPTLTERAGQSFYVLNLGKNVPPVGTYLLAEPIAGRWCVSF